MQGMTCKLENSDGIAQDAKESESVEHPVVTFKRRRPSKKARRERLNVPGPVAEHPATPSTNTNIVAQGPDGSEGQSNFATSHPSAQATQDPPITSVGEERGENTSDEEVGLRKEIDLLRMSQRLRDRRWRGSLLTGAPTGASADVRADARAVVGTPGDGAAAGAYQEVGGGGLTSQFAVESSGYNANRQMEEYVEARMAETFGRQYAASRVAGGTGTKRARSPAGEEAGAVAAGEEAAEKDDEELYAVPDHLRVEGRALYDPSEGLPAAGMEEIDIGVEAKLKNAEETAKARKALVERRERERQRGAGTGARSLVTSNLSANFDKHRRDWIEEHVDPGKRRGGTRRGGFSRGRGGLGGCAQGVDRENRGVDESRGDIEPGSQSRDGSCGRGSRGRRRRYSGPVATDHVVADRFRKRWRK